MTLTALTHISKSLYIVLLRCLMSRYSRESSTVHFDPQSTQIESHRMSLQCSSRLLVMLENKRLGKEINSPSFPTLNGNVLKGSDPPWPCRGGAPGLKKLEKLVPTFHTSTVLSSSDNVSSLRPSGEKLDATIRFLCPSRTYNLVPVLRSYMITAPSLVPTARRWVVIWKSTVGNLVI